MPISHNTRDKSPSSKLIPDQRNRLTLMKTLLTVIAEGGDRRNDMEYFVSQISYIDSIIFTYTSDGVTTDFFGKTAEFLQEIKRLLAKEISEIDLVKGVTKLGKKFDAWYDDLFPEPLDH
ncbi:MAG: hypothetical protein M1840_003247 [Geoglossum simile]|nr:MAG: hypothetical protein M1840_003247 [Geoglossum simile]